METNLEKAIRLFPIGTSYWPAKPTGHIEPQVVKYKHRDLNGDIEAGFGYLYRKKEDSWATPVETITNDYPIF